MGEHRNSFWSRAHPASSLIPLGAHPLGNSHKMVGNQEDRDCIDRVVFKPETKEAETRALCIEIGMRVVTKERPKGTDKMP